MAYSGEVDRFWAKVDKNGPTPAHMPHLGPCWLWTACRNVDGYGLFTIGSRKDGTHRCERAHRVAFAFLHGHWPSVSALHHCDNPRCVRPAHLFEGNQQQNIADMNAKGRRENPRGEAVGTSLIGADVVRELRLAASVGATSRAQAALYGLSKSQVNNIVNGVSWAHVT